MKMSDGQGASRVIRPDRRGPGALGDRRENVAALERAWRAVDTTAAFIAGEAALRRKHAVGRIQGGALHTRLDARSEEHTSELQSLMRNSYAVFCLKKKT